METNIQILQHESLQALNKSEVDIAISTAKAYPRKIDDVVKEIENLCCRNKETAESCFYALPRKQFNKETGKWETKTISGESIRLAEIVVNCFGNINAGYRVISNDGKTVTGQGICHDLEKNVRIACEVVKKITNAKGESFTYDMQIVTGNAAGATAFRNAVFKVVPKALYASLIEKIKETAIGKSIDIETSRKNAIIYFQKLGVSEKDIFDLLSIKSINEIGREELLTLTGLKTALKDGETTIDESFGKARREKESAPAKVAEYVPPAKNIQEKKEPEPEPEAEQQSPEDGSSADFDDVLKEIRNCLTLKELKEKRLFYIAFAGYEGFQIVCADKEKELKK